MSLQWVLETLEDAYMDSMPPLPACWLPESAGADDPPCRQLVSAVRKLCALRAPAPAVKGHTLYAMLPRHTAAIYHEGVLYPGTLLRCLPLLFHLKRMGVGIVYLLPIFKMGTMALKGDVPSPYAIADFMALDASLHDSALGPYSPEALDKTFAAFVEACHKLGMRVLLDFVFRTCARDNDLFPQHPGWFYYVRADQPFNPPHFADIKQPTAALPGVVRRLKKTPDYRRFAAQFVQNPRVTDSQAFERAMEVSADTPALMRLEQQLNVTTAPAFCDVINDPQPPWSDVTYLRYELAEDAHAPCMFYDHIKLAHYGMKRPNTELMDYLGGVVPYYARRFGIDGARIDMGHALPEYWVREIIQNTRAIRKDFLFWCEQLDSRQSKLEKPKGYDFMTGSLFMHFQSRNARALAEAIKTARLPLLAAAETPDTPRSAQKLGTLSAASATLFSLFLPNAYPMLNAGVELSEIQPLNLGLLSEPGDRYALPQSHPFYGKLAFFDACAMDWSSSGFTETIARAQRIAAQWQRADKRISADTRQGHQALVLRARLPHQTLLCIYNMGEKPYPLSKWIGRKNSPQVAYATQADCLTQKPWALQPGAFAAVLINAAAV